MGRRARQRLPLATGYGTVEGLRSNVSLVVAIDKSLVAERVGKLSLARIRAVVDGIGLVLGR